MVINNLDGAPTVPRNDGGNRQNFLIVELEGRKIATALVTCRHCPDR